MQQLERVLYTLNKQHLPVEVALWADNCTFNEWFCWTSRYIRRYTACTSRDLSLRTLHAFYLMFVAANAFDDPGPNVNRMSMLRT